MINPGNQTTVATTGASGRLEWNRPADRLRVAAEAAYQGYRDDPMLSVEGRQSLIAKVYLKLQDDMADLQRAAGVSTAADMGALKRAVFGIDAVTKNATAAEQAAITMSFRDAQERASQITSEAEADQLLETATQTGDELLAQAVFNFACGGGPFYFTGVVDTFLSARPEKALAWSALNAANRPVDAAALFEYVVPTPPELNGTNPAAVALKAAGG